MKAIQSTPPVDGKYVVSNRSRRLISRIVLGGILLFLLVSGNDIVFAQGRFSQNRDSGRVESRRENKKNNDVNGNQAGLSTFEQEMRDSLKRIPWDELSNASKAKIKSVVQQHSLFRRMPTQAVYCDPEIFQYLLEHPDLVVGFWEQLGVTQISLRQIKDDRYLMKESTGTVANVEVVHRGENMCIVYAKGQYRGPFLARSIDGESVLILRTRYGTDTDGEPYVVCRLDAFMKIDNLGADLLAKLFSTSLGKIADGNFEQTVAFVGQVSDAASVNGGSVQRICRQTKGVREEVRNDFIDVVDRVALRSAKREQKLFPQYYAVETTDKGETWLTLPADTTLPDVLDRESDFAHSVLDRLGESAGAGVAGKIEPKNDESAFGPAPRSYATPSLPVGSQAIPSENVPERRGAVFGTPKIVRPSDE